MISKKNRLTRSEISTLLRSGKYLRGPTLSLRYLRSPKSSNWKTGITISKKVFKLATKRNSARRQFYRVISGGVGFKGGAFLFILNKPVEKDVLSKEITSMLEVLK